MFGILDFLFIKFWSLVAEGFTLITNSFEVFLIYIKRLTPFYNMCFEVFNSYPTAITDIYKFCFIVLFLVMFFTALKRGKGGD